MLENNNKIKIFPQLFKFQVVFYFLYSFYLKKTKNELQLERELYIYENQKIK